MAWTTGLGFIPGKGKSLFCSLRSPHCVCVPPGLLSSELFCAGVFDGELSHLHTAPPWRMLEVMLPLLLAPSIKHMGKVTFSPHTILHTWQADTLSALYMFIRVTEPYVYLWVLNELFPKIFLRLLLCLPSPMFPVRIATKRLYILKVKVKFTL